MTDISRGKKEEFYEIIDFLDFVFSKSSAPHDFIKMLPYLYMPTDESMNAIINLREDGAIKASLLSAPYTMNVLGEELKVCGIGSVATHPRSGGKGYMSKLLNYNIEQMKKDGVHLSHLVGKRSRYSKFGYDNAGNCISTKLTLRELNSYKRDFDTQLYSFVKVSKDDAQLISALKKIYESKSLYYSYNDEKFYLRFSSFGSCVYAIYDKANTLQGYINVSPANADNGVEVRELCLRKDSDITDCLISFAFSKQLNLYLAIPDWQLDSYKEIFDYSIGITKQFSSMWLVLDWHKVLEVLFKFKATYAPLEEGSLVIEIKDNASFKLEYSQEKGTTVSKTDEKPDISLDALKAGRVILGPIFEDVFGYSLPLEVCRLAKSWFPLPLTLFGTETV